MKDENIGKTIGIFKILGISNTRRKDGHKLYDVECIICGQKSTKRKSEMECTKYCKHVLLGRESTKNCDWVWSNKRLKRIFKGMKYRCYDPNWKDYARYGGAGIRVFQEWIEDPKLFENWVLNNGYKDNLTIDRIDSTKDYCPENCRWITLEENARRAGKVNWVTVDDETLTGNQWAKKLGVGKNLINNYIREKGLDFAIDFIKNKLQNS